jgi:hypothetical protein
VCLRVLFEEEPVGVNACCGGPSWKTEEIGLWKLTSGVKRKGEVNTKDDRILRKRKDQD